MTFSFPAMTTELSSLSLSLYFTVYPPSSLTEIPVIAPSLTTAESIPTCSAIVSSWLFISVRELYAWSTSFQSEESSNLSQPDSTARTETHNAIILLFSFIAFLD